MSPPIQRIVSVAGAGNATPAETEWAEAVGRGIAKLGAVLVTGGRGGVMEAASRGAAQAGGETIGILPGLNRCEGNPHVRIPIPTGLGDLRNFLVARSGEVLVAIGGRLGTLSEVAIALKSGIPVVGLSCPRFDADQETLHPDLDDLFHRVTSAKEALEWTTRLLDKTPPP